MWEWQKWWQLLILYINIVTLWYYPWENQMYSNDFQALNSAGNGYNCIHTYSCMLIFCVAAIIYYIIVNLAYAFMKSTNAIYHKSGLEKTPISPWLVTLLHIHGVIPTTQLPISLETSPQYCRKLHSSAGIAARSTDVATPSADIVASNGSVWVFRDVSQCFMSFMMFY